LGTMTVPCFVVIIIPDGSVVCSCWASAGVSGICSTVAGAQSWPPQHSFGYQSWAHTLPVTATIIAASSNFGIFINPPFLQKGLPFVAGVVSAEREGFPSGLRTYAAKQLSAVTMR